MAKTQDQANSFIQELRNRRVFRVATVYVGAVFALLQGADILFPIVNAPEWSMKVLSLLLLAGFPIAIVLAWMFQFTPEGIRRSPKSGEKQSAEEKPLTSNGIIIALLVVIALLLAYPHFSQTPTAKSKAAIAPEKLIHSKSIAVLPFTPFADEREDEIFADGVHDDILTQLSKIADLKVISRTSVMQYKGTTKLIPDIAKELGVANVLEGSVRRAGDQIRIVAQLINAQNDEHLWAETFDRKYADIFSVQTEVAKKIASALQATLTPREQAYIEEKPTDNLEAYNYYMQGKLSFESYTGQLTKVNVIENAVTLYKQAIELDPEMLLAYTGLVEAYVQRTNNGMGIKAENKAFAYQYLNKAIELNEDHPSVYKAKGLIAYYTDWDYEKALEYFNQSLKASPNDSEILSYIAAVVRRQARFDQSRDLYKRAIAINPRSASLIYNAYTTSLFLHKWDEVAMYIDLLIALEPESVYWKGSKALNDFNRTGDLDASIAYLYSIEDDKNLDDIFGNIFWLTFYKRDRDGLRNLLDTFDPSSWYSYYAYYGIAEQWLGNHQKSQLYFDSLRTGAEEQLKRVPDDVETMGELGYALIALGEKEAGLQLAKRAVELKPVSVDAMIGSRLLWNLFDALALAEEKAEAITLLERLLTMPSEFSIYDLKFDPRYDILRDDPRFKALINKYDKG